MSSTTAKELKNFKSKIPVPILKVKTFNKYEEKKENGKNFPSVCKASSCKSNGNPLPLLKANSKTRLVKSLKENKPFNNSNKVISSKLSKKAKLLGDEKHQSSNSSNQTSNKSLQIENKEASCCTSTGNPLPLLKASSETRLVKSLKENKPFNNSNKVISSKLSKKAKLLGDKKHQSSNSSIQTSDKDLQIEKNIFENQEQPVISPFSAQKGIKFEGNEIYRQMILRGRDLSPSICRLAPGVKLSSAISRRPSFYSTGFQVHPDPHAYAMQAIEKMSATRGNRKLTLPAERMTMSPSKVKNVLYTPGVNPEDIVMKHLNAIRDKQMQKIALKSSQKGNPRKVTFAPEPKPFSNSENKLTHINEASSVNTPSILVSKSTNTNGEKEENFLKSSALESLNECGKSAEQDNGNECLKTIPQILPNCIDQSKQRTAGIKLCTPQSKSFSSALENLNECSKSAKQDDGHERLETLPKILPTYLDPLKQRTTEMKLCTPQPISFSSALENLTECGKSAKQDNGHERLKTIPQILSTCLDQRKQRTTEMKLCTPRPISFSSNSRLLHNCSPEFLDTRSMGNMSNFAPIYTPLVLKSIAQHSAESPENLSPVKLKLDFAAAESDTPKKEISGKCPSVKNIVTATKLSDSLADKECDIFLSNENFPVLCGRYLLNPVAVTLTKGDEMHFLPICE